MKSERSSETKAMRRPVTFIRRAACVGLVAMGLAGCRMDMHIQPKYLPYDGTNFWGDGRSERQPVPGTVARGQLKLDELFYTGKENGVLADEFPFPITQADIERGRQRFNIYCTPCHGYTGDGHGMIVQRGFPTPPSYHIERLRDAPAGHFFDVITNGYGAMYSYATRVEPADRWRIVAYIRAMQLSENARIDDVPQADREKLAQQPRGQSGGASQ